MQWSFDSMVPVSISDEKEAGDCKGGAYLYSVPSFRHSTVYH